MQAAPKPRGRPRSPRRAGERATLSLRITAELFMRLDAEAKRKGRPLSNEAELRLEQSFQTDETAFGGPRTAELLRRLGEVAQQLHGPYSQDDWMDDPIYFNEIVDRWNKYLEEIKPKISDAERTQRRQEQEEFKAMIATASSSAAETLRRHAREFATFAHLDADERAAWAKIGNEKGGAS